MPYNTTKAPYQQQWNLNVQRDLGRGTILSVGYVGSRGVHLFSQENLNPSITSTSAAPGCGVGPLGGLLNACSTPTGTPCVPTLANGNLSSCKFGAFDPIVSAVEPILPRVNDNYASLNENVTKGTSNYNSLQVSLVRQAARGIVMQLSYTYSHCLTNNSGSYGLEEGAVGLLDPYDPRYDYGNCTFDLRHNFVGNVIYQLPFRGNRLVEGWQVSGIVTLQSGSPFSVMDGFDQAGLNNNVADTRPNVTPGCNPYVNKRVAVEDPEHLSSRSGSIPPALVSRSNLPVRWETQSKTRFSDLVTSTWILPCSRTRRSLSGSRRSSARSSSTSPTARISWRRLPASLRPRVQPMRERSQPTLRLYRRHCPQHPARDSVRPEIDLLIGIELAPLY